MQKIGYIYKITSPTGRVYVGQTENVNKREGQYKNLHCKKQKVIYSSIKKYGWDKHKFEVVDQVDMIFIDFWEEYYVRHFNSYKGFNKKGGMNLTFGGCTNRGRIVTQATRLKLSKASKGRVTSEEVKLKISIAGKGRKHSQDTKDKISLKNKNKIVTLEQREKISKTLVGRYIGNEHHNPIPVLNLETGIYYETITEASKSAGIRNETLRRYLNGIRQNKTPFILIEHTPQNEVFYKSKTKRIINTISGQVYDSLKELCKIKNYNESTMRTHLTGHNKKKINYKYL